MTPQHAPLAAPLYAQDNPENILLLEMDLTPPRARIVLILLGHAKQPEVDAPPLIVCAALGDWTKNLLVHPPLRWNKRGVPEADPDAQPRRIALNYTAAFGGADFAANPLGHGYGQPPGSAPARPVALTIPGEAPQSAGQRLSVAGFGAVPRTWPPRLHWGGTYDTRLQEQRAPLLPEDFDQAYWQLAPADQHLAREATGGLLDGCVLRIGGFDGTGPATAPTAYGLPQIGLGTTTRIAGHWHTAPALLQSIVADLDSGLVRLCYQSVWPLPRTDADIHVNTTIIKLSRHDGFRVSAGDAGLFMSANSTPEVAT